MGDRPKDIACRPAKGEKVLAEATGGYTLQEIKLHRADLAVPNLQEASSNEVVLDG